MQPKMTRDIPSELRQALDSHPCYNDKAHKNFARMHLPVAPGCNIQCNYCNRKYDCSNESRPGVTSEVLSPEQALAKVSMVKEKIPELSVVAIAGPGDPLANEETFETMALVKKEFPDLTLCLSTNGLMLPENLDRIKDLGIGFVTVTINAVDPAVGERIYDFVRFQGRNYKGREAAEVLLRQQLEGIKGAVERGMLVKANMVLIPDINGDHIPEAVKVLKELGVYIINILPLIPVEGTAFSDQRAPTAKERKELQDRCSDGVRMMRHCKQCRADAIGLLGQDRQDEFAKAACGSSCGPGEAMQVSGPSVCRSIALASSDGLNVDGGLGNSPSFLIFDVKDGAPVEAGRTEVNLDMDAPLVGEAHRRRLKLVVDQLSQHSIVIVTGAGDLARSMIEAKGVRLMIFRGTVQEALKAALEGFDRDD